VWNPWLVFERFTERARQVVVLAQEEARTLKHNYIGTEHLLLGLLREQEGLAARALESLGITVEGVRAEIVRTVGSGEEVTSGQIPFTPRAKKVLELALREALSLGHDYIGTEHILLGLVRENDGVATRILLDSDADSEKIRNEVTRMLSGSGARPGGAVGPVPRAAYVGHPPDLPRPVLDWHRANILWRPEGLELRIPLHLNEGALAAFAADEVWSTSPLEGMRREIWDGWLALASPSLLDEADPVELRQALDAAARRALGVSGREHGRVEDFLRRLRDAG
jgi:Clp amino terminal domain, pathogenicity island component